jgi:hypothetical protein
MKTGDKVGEPQIEGAVKIAWKVPSHLSPLFCAWIYDFLSQWEIKTMPVQQIDAFHFYHPSLRKDQVADLNDFLRNAWNDAAEEIFWHHDPQHHSENDE